MKINLKEIKVDNLSDTSGIFSCDNLQVDWKHSTKTNEGFGTIIGNKNTSTDNHHTVQKYFQGSNKDLN